MASSTALCSNLPATTADCTHVWFPTMEYIPSGQGHLSAPGKPSAESSTQELDSLYLLNLSIYFTTIITLTPLFWSLKVSMATEGTTRLTSGCQHALHATSNEQLCTPATPTFSERHGFRLITPRRHTICPSAPLPPPRPDAAVRASHPGFLLNSTLTSD